MKKQRSKEAKKRVLLPGLMSLVLLAIGAIAYGQASSPNGCLGGGAIDAATGNAVSQGEVQLLGRCVGSGCDPSPFGTSADISTIGRWVTDAYANDPEDVTPFSTVESVLLQYIVPGYHTTVVFHTPVYSTGSSGKQYSDVQPVPMAPDTDTDVDGDGLYSTQETYFGTVDSAADADNDGVIDSVDTDGDGLSDYAEVFGENFIDLPGMGADPLVPDVFVEIDCLEGYCPTADDLEDINDMYDSAPIAINVHVIVDDEIPATEYDDELLTYSEFIALKDEYFNSSREPYFRYSMWTGDQPDRGGISYDEGFLIEDTISEDHIFVHELGHQLGLGHGGHNNVNCKPNYFSVMNYIYAYDLERDGSVVIDYSPFKPGNLDEGDLDEPFGIPQGSATSSELSRYTVDVGQPVNDCGHERELNTDATAPLDWNDDGDADDLGVALEFLFDDQAGPGFHTSESHDDWRNLTYITGDIGAMLPTQGSPGLQVENGETITSLRQWLQSQLALQGTARSTQRGQELLKIAKAFSETQITWFRAVSPLHNPTPTYVCPQP